MKKALHCLALLGAVTLAAWPTTTEATDCLYAFEYCTQSFCPPNDEVCLLACECEYYYCTGLQAPTYCR